MVNKFKLSPSVFAADLGMLKHPLSDIEINEVELLHVDVMDVHFVERRAFGADHIKALKKLTHLPLDVHLMVQKPEVHLDSIIAAGADIITIHQEATNRHISCLQKIRKAGIKAGIVLNPGTCEENIKYLLNDIDMVLLMTVNPGEGGQHFLMSVVDKIKRVRSLVSNYNIDIEVDGSIDDKTIKYCRDAGANIFVSGGYLFNGNITDNITKLRVSLAA